MDLSSLLLDLVEPPFDTVRHVHQDQLLGAELPGTAMRYAAEEQGLGFHLPAAGRA
jgi:hypothetical protein